MHRGEGVKPGRQRELQAESLVKGERTKGRERKKSMTE